VLREPYDGAVDLIESAVVSSYNESLRDLAGMLLCVSSADLVVLTDGCLNYKACEIIHSCCEHYRVPVMEIRL
jgi:hypothetical protein